MQCHQLARRLQELQPDATPAEIARLCVLIFSQLEAPEQLSSDAAVAQQWRRAQIRVQAAADQHAAMTGELEQLCAGDAPVRFQPEQVWTLLRAIKVQSQILEMYVDQPVTA